MRPLAFFAASLLGAALLAASGLAGASGPLTLEEAEAGKRCSGAKRSPQKLKVMSAQRLVKCLVNKRREARGLKRLKRQKAVTRAATRHTRHMQSRNCFSHRCPGEPDLVGRLARADYLPCGCSWKVRENIAYGNGKRRGSPAKIVKAWMRSSTHRAVLLSSGVDHIGVGFRRGSPFKDKRKLATYTLVLGGKR